MYLALRGAPKAAIASILRSELLGSRVAGSELNQWGVERWEQMAGPRIKAVLEALVETVTEDQDWVHDAAAIIGRVMVSANAGDWRNSVSVRAMDYMKAARLGLGRRDIRKARQEMARQRAKAKKKAVERNTQQHVSAAGIATGNGLIGSLDTGSGESQSEGSSGSLASEDDMLVNLVKLQDNGMVCGQHLSYW